MTANGASGAHPVAWSERPGTPSEFLAGVAARLARWEPELRAFTHVDLDRAAVAAAEADARWAAGTPLSPIDGMPVAVKEIIDSAEFPTELGSSLFAGRRPEADAEAVARLRAAGAIVIGMTTSTPFACGTTTVTANPHDLARTPGGSSAGSGAAVGAGIVPAALASQTGASTIRPASYCGAVGYKPSHRRLPMGGVHPVAPSLDDVGVIAASVDDLALVAAVLAAGTPDAPPERRVRPRLGLVRLDSGDEPDPESWAALEVLLARLDETGTATVTRSEHDPGLAAFDAEVAGSTPLVFDLFAAEAAPILAPYVDAARPDPEPDPRIRDLVERGPEQSAKHLATIHALRARLRHRLQALSERYDALVTLSTANVAPLGHTTTGSRTMPATWSFLGAPALSLPLLEVDGLPLGLQLLGFPDRDDELIALARILTAPPAAAPRIPPAPAPLAPAPSAPAPSATTPQPEPQHHPHRPNGTP
ncbi:amidase [Herbiconiux moechotypicola]|uniref:Amidase n=1 Tax=Herbiconiux moechotypicola TaxID=637393 RepID=A0ABN3DL09_9MICO|nr:amidase [Herbiconiux moechotypicola]MCS5730088.1 amidase [Herbiconiux moechotypicola]